ncbi:hypothetical protein P3S68_000346 [Capsicum galapagoense]
MADKGKTKISLEDLGEGQVNDFSTYHLQTFDSELNFDITDSDDDSLYDVDENIEELSDFDEELLQARNSNQDSDISEEEGDHVDDDELIDPLPRTSSSKIYLDKTAKKKKDFSSDCDSQSSVQTSTGTAVVAAAERPANALAAEEMSANAKLCNRRPANAHNAPRGAGRPTNAHSAPRAAGRPVNAALVGDVRPASASTTDIRPATVVIFTATSTSENTDRVLHSPTLISSVSINIDLGFKPNGLRWKGEVAVTQR